MTSSVRTRTTPPTAAPESASARQAGAFGIVHRLHTIAGLFVAPLLIVAALSGLLYAFAPTLENIVYRAVLTASSTPPAQPVSEQVAVAQRVHPNLDLSAVQSSDDPTQTTRVLFDDPALPSSSYRQAVFVDPGSLEITGELVQYGSSRALPLRTWISEGHRHLWLGEPGRIYSETAASWLGILALAGVWLWWSRRRSAKNKRNARASGQLSPPKKARNWHTLLGLWFLPGFLFLTVTGLTWSMVAGANISQLRSELNWIQPTPQTSITASAGHDGGEHSHHGGNPTPGDTSQVSVTELDTVLPAARADGMSGIIELTVPGEDDAAWLVQESRESWKLANDAISVDGTTGEIVDRVDHADWPVAAELSSWLIQLHMGTLFGWINQLVLGAIAVGLLVVTGFGYRMWWLRGRGNRPGRLPAAGRWRRTRPLVLAGLIAFLLAYAVMAPLFGISLVLFLLIDAAVQGLRRARRSSAISARPSTTA